METLLLILSITFVILQIMLFFKIWAMTDNIRLIKENLHNMSPKVAAIEYMKGNKDKAKDIIDTCLYSDFLNLQKEQEEYIYSQNYQHDLRQLVSRYKEIYDRMNIDMPDLEAKEKH